MKLLLHACCGPCSLEPVRLLQEQGHQITIFFANSNIAPKGEYEKRFDTLSMWAAEQSIPVIEGTYDAAIWKERVASIGKQSYKKVQKELHDAKDPTPTALKISEADAQKRCRECYRMRFKEAARVAHEQGFDGVGTTLSVSPHQFIPIIQEELERACMPYGLTAVFDDYRPFFPEAERRSKEEGMYRQNYCGCGFSRAEANAQRAKRKAERKREKEAKRAERAAKDATSQQAAAAKKAERQAYDKKQAQKRAVLKALREQARSSNQGDENLSVGK